MTTPGEFDDVERYLHWIDEHRDEIDRVTRRALRYFVAEGLAEEGVTEDGVIGYRLTEEGQRVAAEQRRRRRGEP